MRNQNAVNNSKHAYDLYSCSRASEKSRTPYYISRGSKQYGSRIKASYSLGQLVSCDKSTLALPLSLGKSFAGMSHLFLTTPPCYLYCWRYDRVENCRIGHLHGLSCNECATQRTDSVDHDFARRVMNKKIAQSQDKNRLAYLTANFDARMSH